MPPDDGRRVRLELVPAKSARTGRRRMTRYSLESRSVIEPPRSRTWDDDRARHLAAVDRARAVLGEPLQRVREIALDEPLAGDEPPPLRPEDRAALVAVAQDEVDDRVEVRLRRRQLDARSRAGSIAGATQLLPRPRPVDAVRLLEPGGRARDRARGRADAEDLRRLGRSRPRRAPSRRAARRRSPRPGIATKKSTSRLVRSRARWTSMNPPPPGPVSGLSTTQETNAAAMQASTALPPSASTRAPASAVSGWPAAIAPLTAQRLRN